MREILFALSAGAVAAACVWVALTVVELRGERKTRKGSERDGEVR